MPGFDFHTHCFPEKVAASATEALEANYGVPLVATPVTSELKQGLAKAGLDVACIQPVATRPKQVPSIARWAASVNEQATCWQNLVATGEFRTVPGSGPEVISFASLHPADTSLEANIALLRKLQLIGLKFQPKFQQFLVDSPEAVRVYKLVARDFICLFHSGQEFPPLDFLPSTPERLARVLEAVPDVLMVIAHTGGYQVWEDVKKYLLGAPVYFDISYTLGDLPDEEFLKLARSHGLERLLFGTDWPLCNQADYLERFLALPLTPEEKQAILFDNAARLLETGWQRRLEFTA